MKNIQGRSENMPLIARGTQTLKSIPIDSLEDVFGVKNQILDRLDFTYTLESYSKYDEDNILDVYSDVEEFYKATRESDEDIHDFLGHEIYYSHSIYEPLSIYLKQNKYRIVLNAEFDLYKCDICKGLFLDYKNYYGEEKSMNVKNGKECCNDCYRNMLKKFKKEVFKEALTKLADEYGIKISKQQKYICEVLKGIPNVQIGNFFADIMIESDKVVVEYDGSGHWLQTVFKENVTKSDVDKRDRLRDLYLNKKGYKVLRIISEQDFLPSEKEIVKLYKKALLKFSKGENRIKVNIMGLYKKDELRKITKSDLLEVN